MKTSKKVHRAKWWTNFCLFCEKAKNLYVTIDSQDGKNEAFVVVTDEELSIAIGKGGSNIKLASKLTKHHITVKSMSQVNEEGNKNAK